jgi:RNA polymerase sigma factor (sigma-70 family)
MKISSSAWEQVQSGLVEDFVDLFLPPTYPFNVQADYPRTASMEALVKGQFSSLVLPETKLLCLEQLLEGPSLEDFPSRAGDWATLFAYELLQGFGQDTALNLQGETFEGLRQLANTWGLYLAREMERAFRRHELFAIFPDFLEVCRQLPAKALGETMRESITPAFVRAGEVVRYDFALLHNDRNKLKESLSILEASDAELEQEIARVFGGYSTKELGSRVQRMLAEIVSELRELFSSDEFKEQFRSVWPTALRSLSWYIGRRLWLNLRNEPQKTARLLEAINRRKEIAAVLEQYRHRYGWQGDENKAIQLGWRAVAPRYFHISGNVQAVKQDEDQEKLIGLAQGLSNYAGKTPAVVAIRDGFFGKLGAYLRTAARNQELDYVRQQNTDGNIALSEAEHSQDLTSADDEEERLLDDEILSREKERYQPSRDPVFEEVATKEQYEIWHKSLTEREQIAVKLKAKGCTEEEIAEKMGISQQRVSQLIRQAWGKWHKIPR